VDLIRRLSAKIAPLDIFLGDPGRQSSAFAPHVFGHLGPGPGPPLRDAYFGETHVHTSWSLDAWTFGDRETGPGDAYKYFKGETIKAPLGYDIRIDTPLDFAGVTDHSEYVGVVNEANDPSSPVSKLPAAQPLILKNNSPEEAQRVFVYVVTHLMGGAPNKALMSPRGRAHGLGQERAVGEQGQRTRQIHRLLQL
jgi:hypothetical protein